MVACFSAATTVRVSKLNDYDKRSSTWAQFFSALEKGSQQRVLHGNLPILALNLTGAVDVHEQDIEVLLQTLPTLQ